MDEILKQEMQKELTTRILPYWMERMVDQENGGFYGRITGQEELMPRADKGAILNARILWTYSAAYRLLGREEYNDTLSTTFMIPSSEGSTGHSIIEVSRWIPRNRFMPSALPFTD